MYAPASSAIRDLQEIVAINTSTSPGGLPPHTGLTRTSIQRNHAVVTPESHVPVILPGWDNTEVIVVISAELGAKFEQCIVMCHADAHMQPLRADYELFALVLEGSLQLTIDGTAHEFAQDSFCYLPPNSDWQIESAGEAKLATFSKPWVPLGDLAPPEFLLQSLATVPAEPFLGDEGALLQVLLPDDPRFDWGINLFEFVPGGTLPNVESHFMEHGLMLLAGQGVYRLDESWYPVTAGDCIWMGPYVPQWYAAVGKTNSRYVYYKEMNRPPVGG